MPFATNDGVRLYWRLDGAADLPVVVLLNSIGTDMSLWDAALAHLNARFRTLRMDARGHGASDAPDGDYSLALLSEDVVAVMRAAGVERAFVAGVSLGGMIGMELALRSPERIAALALICTSAEMDRQAWEDRVRAVRSNGTEAIADAAMARFLSPVFAKTHAAKRDGLRRSLVAMDRAGYAGAGAAIRDMGILSRLEGIGCSTLVVAGDHDVSTPYDGHGSRIVERVAGARAVHIASGHLAPIEAPAPLAAALTAFFLPKPDEQAAADTLYAAGLANRRRVLGDAWVDRSLDARTAFTTEFQAMITRIAWQEIWGRPGLDETTRRLLVVAITAATGRLEEFGLHVRAGIAQGGFTRDALKEVLMQTAIYAGVPAANTAFAEAGRILAEIDAETPPSSADTGDEATR